MSTELAQCESLQSQYHYSFLKHHFRSISVALKLVFNMHFSRSIHNSISFSSSIFNFFPAMMFSSESISKVGLAPESNKINFLMLLQKLSSGALWVSGLQADTLDSLELIYLVHGQRFDSAANLLIRTEGGASRRSKNSASTPYSLL